MKRAEHNEPRLITVGVIATTLGVVLHRVEYVLRTRTHIRPAARAGRLRLYDLNAVEEVRRVLSESNAKGVGHD